MKLRAIAAAFVLLACAGPERARPKSSATEGATAASATEVADLLTASPKAIDSAFKAWAVAFDNGLTHSRDSLLALAKHDAGTPLAIEKFEAAHHLMNAWDGGGVFPFFHFKCSEDTAHCKHVDSLSDSLARFLDRRGLWYRENNGTQGGADNSALLKLFGPYVPPAFVAFRELKLRDDGSWEEERRGVTVPWDKLGELVVALEGFIEANPNFRDIDDAKAMFKTDRDLFVAGGEYNPVFSKADGDSTLLPAVKRAFDGYVRAHPRSPTAQLITDFVGVLQADGYVQSPTVIAFLKSKNIVGNYPR